MKGTFEAYWEKNGTIKIVVHQTAKGPSREGAFQRLREADSKGLFDAFAKFLTDNGRLRPAK